jgi:hypothetical protein
MIFLCLLVQYRGGGAGIERPLMACCGHGRPPYNYNLFKACMSAEMQLCDVGAHFISWDTVHLTETPNAIVATKVLTGDYSTQSITIAGLANDSTLDNNNNGYLTTTSWPLLSTCMFIRKASLIINTLIDSSSGLLLCSNPV